MESVPQKISFPQVEEEISAYWKEIDAFHTQEKRLRGKPEFTFFDGPPFATGLPHYGHILAGTIKDTVTRYACQTGHHVDRRFGWDCHGLPIEFEIDKQEGVKTKDDVLKMGIDKYNEACRGIVMRYSAQWEKIVTRLGRWIDFENDYKTMDPEYMESVWNVFYKLYKKDLVFRGFKVMPYSTSCTTPLSNFEVQQNYKSTKDIAMHVSFPLKEDPEVSFVAWTTTPWTLPSNLALCVHPKLEYFKIKDNSNGKLYIMGTCGLNELYPAPKKSKKKKKKGNAEAEAPKYEVLEKYLGADLKDKEYEPIFNYFESYRSKGAFRILLGDYVTDASGTGIVHQAPAFGEDDFKICEAAKIISKEDIPCPVDDNGRFEEVVSDFKGLHVKQADPTIRDHIKGLGRCVKAALYEHNYPFCWRSDTPLIYKAVPSWFIRVTSLKEQLLKANETTYWVPSAVKKRFHNWLEGSIDWAVSRNRYWGTPIPLWANEDYSEVKCIKSIEHLAKLSGVTITDLHRHNIDHITIPSKTGKGVLRRVEEVFDCWFESGSMPYAQVHYPFAFKNDEEFKKRFPADFIAEGIDQTRGWFYTMLVISTALFGESSFKNLIANGLVLAEDGKKMSKRLKNYPDPTEIINNYGADALRMYLLNSPVVRGEEVKFQQQQVFDVVKDAMLPWFNSYRFLVQNGILAYEKRTKKTFTPDITVCKKTTNLMDKWILASTQSLVEYVRAEMAAYHLYSVGPKLVEFIEQLTNWYIRFNRTRIKGKGVSEEDCLSALNTLYEVVMTLTKSLDPFAPFFTEYLYQNLKKCQPKEKQEDSIHYLDFPAVDNDLVDTDIEVVISEMQSIIELSRAARDRRTVPIKYPLRHLTVIVKDPNMVSKLEKVVDYIKSELNVWEVSITAEQQSYVSVTATPVFNRLGARLKKDTKKVCDEIKKLSHDKITKFIADGSIDLFGHELGLDDIEVVRTFSGDKVKYEADWHKSTLVVLDVELDDELISHGAARTVVSSVQRLRKSCGVKEGDAVEVFFVTDSKGKAGAVLTDAAFLPSIKSSLAIPFSLCPPPPSYVIIGKTTVIVEKSSLEVYLVNRAFAFNEKALGENASAIKQFVLSRDYSKLLATLQKDGKITVTLNGKEVTLSLGKELYLDRTQCS